MLPLNFQIRNISHSKIQLFEILTLTHIDFGKYILECQFFFQFPTLKMSVVVCNKKLATGALGKVLRYTNAFWHTLIHMYCSNVSDDSSLFAVSQIIIHESCAMTTIRPILLVRDVNKRLIRRWRESSLVSGFVVTGYGTPGGISWVSATSITRSRMRRDRREWKRVQFPILNILHSFAMFNFICQGSESLSFNNIVILECRR